MTGHAADLADAAVKKPRKLIKEHDLADTWVIAFARVGDDTHLRVIGTVDLEPVDVLRVGLEALKGYCDTHDLPFEPGWPEAIA